ncbi:hypothetical protein DEO72_LG10g1937 [Vigna unguiculata]|uniref:Uncharacterized protein n=1 Tax=Vigna unguiculata TaxID=3917 RepID=A0A4D6NAE1_VIGUN|nr:hypothetical protein DEO72_LG10g1937 [Vigna unguiculata]
MGRDLLEASRFLLRRAVAVEVLQVRVVLLRLLPWLQDEDISVIVAVQWQVDDGRAVATDMGMVEEEKN